MYFSRILVKVFLMGNITYFEQDCYPHCQCQSCVLFYRTILNSIKSWLIILKNIHAIIIIGISCGTLLFLIEFRSQWDWWLPFSSISIVPSSTLWVLVNIKKVAIWTPVRNLHFLWNMYIVCLWVCVCLSYNCLSATLYAFL